jgi:hypothetical protein
MSELLFVVVAGLVAGSLHVVAGPDHLAALAPIAIDNRRRAARTGAVWGFGHGTGVAILGGLGMLTRHLIDLERVSAWSELAVGFLLIAVGLWSIRRAARMTIHHHHHDHDERGRHSHLHVHMGDRPHTTNRHRVHSHAAFGIGLLHGSAGGGHLFGVLPSLALPPAQAAAYLAAYLIAAVVSMAAFGLVLGRLASVAGGRPVRSLMRGTGTLAVIVGVVWIASAWPG